MDDIVTVYDFYELEQLLYRANKQGTEKFLKEIEHD